METFLFTRKRLLSLPEARRHKWIGHWLRQIFLRVNDSSFTQQSFDDFFSLYCRVLGWLAMPLPEKPQENDPESWKEFLSHRFHLHQRATGLGLNERDFLPRVIEGDRLSSEPWQPVIPYRVALDNFRSAFNVGSVIRTVDAVGLAGVIFGGNTPGPLHRQVIKAAMGAEKWIPQETASDLHQFFRREKERGIPIIGVETVEDALDYREFSWPTEGILLLGNEEYGISRKLLPLCHHFIKLPMVGRKNSINVANAFAVIAYALFSSLNPPAPKSIRDGELSDQPL